MTQKGNHVIVIEPEGRAFALDDCQIKVVTHTIDRSDELLTVKQAAKVLKVHPQSVYLMCRKADLRYTRVGSRGIRIQRSEIDRYLKKRGPRGSRAQHATPPTAPSSKPPHQPRNGKEEDRVTAGRETRTRREPAGRRAEG